MPAAAYKVQIHIENRHLRQQFEEFVALRPEFVIMDDKDAKRPDLLLMGIGDDPDSTFEQIHDILINDSAGEIFLVSDTTDQNHIIKAMRAGAREFFGPYTEEQEITSALERFLARQSKIRSETASQSTSQVISILGSKGGVGTTTVAVNLAVQLTKMDKPQSVVLLDMNLFGDIPLFLEIEPTYSWKEITKNISRLDSIFLKNIMAMDPSGLYVLPSPGYLETHNMATPEIMERLFRVMSAMFDYIIVDAGQLLNDPTLKILELSDKVFLVAVQSLPCLAKTNKILRTFRDLGYPHPNNVQIILNRFVKNPNIDKEDVEKTLDKEVFWSLPNDYLTTISAINKGQPLSKVAPKKEITKSFQDLAESLSQSPSEGKKQKKKWWSLFR